MSRRIRASCPLRSISESVLRTVWCVLLWFSLVASLPAHAQQVDSPPQSSSENAVPETHPPDANPSPPTEETGKEPNPTAAAEPAWVTTWDSLGNVRQGIKVQSDFAIGDSARLGLLFGAGFINNTQPQSTVSTAGIRDAEITGQWHPSEVVKFEGMFGVSQASTPVDGSEQTARQTIPTTKVLASLTPPGEIIKVDLGFERSFYDLSPQLVANRVIRNQFVVHPAITLPAGWRLRALAEMGPMTSAGESNARYNSEFTIARKLGTKSELYSTYGMLHFANASNAGYFSPDMVENMEGGWTTDIDRKTLSLSLDFAAGAGHAREHGVNSFGPWGLSLGAQSYLTWTVREGSEVRASYEFYYDKSNPAVESSSSAGWHMSVLTLSFHWAKQ
jgi:hypothetical protein